jgi:hypothetical protein
MVEERIDMNLSKRRRFSRPVQQRRISPTLNSVGALLAGLQHENRRMAPMFVPID